MTTTTNLFWLPRHLITRLHAWWSCASSSWIGRKACTLEDSSRLDTHFLLLHGFPFRRLLCLFQPLSFLESSASSSALYSATTLHPSFDWSAIRTRMSFFRSGIISLPQLRVFCMQTLSSAGNVHGPSRLACTSTSFSTSERWTHGNERTYM